MRPLPKKNRNTTTPAPLTLQTSRACTAVLCVILVSTLNVGHIIRRKAVETHILLLCPLTYCLSNTHKNVTIILYHTESHEQSHWRRKQQHQHRLVNLSPSAGAIYQHATNGENWHLLPQNRQGRLISTCPETHSIDSACIQLHFINSKLVYFKQHPLPKIEKRRKKITMKLTVNQ